MARRGRLARLEDLEAPFAGLSEAEATSAYAQSLSAVAHVLRLGGSAGVRRLIEGLASGRTTAQALPVALGVDYPELQRRWEAHLNDDRVLGLDRRRRSLRSEVSTKRACKPDSVPAFDLSVEDGWRSFL